MGDGVGLNASLLIGSLLGVLGLVDGLGGTCPARRAWGWGLGGQGIALALWAAGRFQGGREGDLAAAVVLVLTTIGLCSLTRQVAAPAVAEDCAPAAPTEDGSQA